MLTRQDLEDEFRWAKMGAFLEFHRVDKFLNDLHIHMFPLNMVPIGNFADKFETSVVSKGLEVGELEGFSVSHVALSASDEDVLKEAVMSFLDMLEDSQQWFYQGVLKNPKNGQIVVLFFPNTKHISFSVSGLFRSKQFNLTKQEILSTIENSFADRRELLQIRDRFLQKWKTANPAQISSTGGIDFNADKMNLETKMDSRSSLPGGRQGGNDSGIQFHIDPAMLERFKNVPGFEPVIINIQPLVDIKQFLGLNT